MDSKERKAEINRKRYHDPTTGYREHQLKANREYYRKNKKRLLEAQKKRNSEKYSESSKRRNYMRKYMKRYRILKRRGIQTYALSRRAVLDKLSGNLTRYNYFLKITDEVQFKNELKRLLPIYYQWAFPTES